MDGRDVWEYASGYSKRNLVENAMFRFKNNIGPKLRARTSIKTRGRNKARSSYTESDDSVRDVRFSKN